MADIKPYCVYCGDTTDLVLSEMIPDNTLYPGVQRMCANHQACLKRIHDKFHGEFPAPECEHCNG